jgi:hypothetical protein
MARDFTANPVTRAEIEQWHREYCDLCKGPCRKLDDIIPDPKARPLS